MAQSTKPLFMASKEARLIESMNQELIDELVGQTVDIYKVNLDETDTNIYGEADETKIFETGFRVNCLIQFNEPEIMTEDFGSDVNATIEMYFLRASLSGAGFYPEVGDVVDWNDFYWEINGTTEPQLLMGHQNYKHQVKATATRMRSSSVSFVPRVK